MAWPRSTHFGFGRNAVTCGRKGGKRSPHEQTRTPEYWRAYDAGWRACHRWYLATNGKVKRGKHSALDEGIFRQRTGQRKGQAA
jgi:hypothetical protein